MRNRSELSDSAFRTRRAAAEDANLVGRISAAAYIPAYLPLIGAAPKLALEDYGGWINCGEVWLAEIDGVPTGVLVLDRRSDHLFVYSVVNEVLMSETPPDGLPRYRILTGKDDAAFCFRVSEALSMGYKLYGSPAVTFNGEHVVVAQAILWRE